MNKRPELDHQALKFLIGLIAFLLPVLAPILSGSDIPSISDSYCDDGSGRDVFVGFLFAIASFMGAYNGPGEGWGWRADRILSRLASVAALGVALFPCCTEGWRSATHYGAAVVMFVVLSVFCWIFFRRAREKANPEAKRRAAIYLVCLGVMVSALLAVGFGQLKSGGPSRLVYWGETVALLAFGVSWLTASKPPLPGLAAAGERLRLRSLVGA